MEIVAVVPAYNCESTIGDTVRALKEDGRVVEVIVVDDGSQDRTGERAVDAGAKLIVHQRNSGKHVALATGFEAAPDADVWAMVDADTAGSAEQVLSLAQPVGDGEADMVIGVLPPAGSAGGFGLVRDLAGWFIRRSCGFVATAPMSGQRALRPEVYRRCRPLSFGYAVDAALTIDAVRRGFRVTERPVDMTHDHKGRSLAGFYHRARQGWHLIRALTPRLLKLR